MVTTPFIESSQVWPVYTRIPDEHEGDILSTTDDHFTIVAAIRGDLERHARHEGLAWLLRAAAPIRDPRADGSIGSLYPDILLAHGVAVPGYGPYRSLEVGKPPELLIEILSKETARKDEDDVKGKRRVYAEMGVFEYLTFDPRPRKKLALHGYRLARIGQYAEIVPASGGGVWLESIGLRVMAETADRGRDRGPLLRFYRPDGSPVPHVWEEADAREQAEQERQRADRERRQAEQARQVERRARLRAERERDDALAEVARLRALVPRPPE